MNLKKFLYAALLTLSLTNYVVATNSIDNTNNVNTSEIDANIEKSYENAIKASIDIFFQHFIQFLKNNKFNPEMINNLENDLNISLKNPISLYKDSFTYITLNVTRASNNFLLGKKRLCISKTYEIYEKDILESEFLKPLRHIPPIKKLASHYALRNHIINIILLEEINKRKL